MNQTFKEVFEEEQQISTAVSKHWGYHVKNVALDSRFKRETDGKIPIVANINTLRMVKDIPKTERILQIEDELKAIQNGRLLTKFIEQAAKKQLTSKAEEGKSPIIALMEEKVKEYNHIVTHKHLNKDYHEETRRILKIDQDETEKFIEDLHQQENKLKTANLSSQITINKYMAYLYKSYRQKIDHNRSKQLKDHSNTKTIISEPAKSARNPAKHEEIPKLERIRHLKHTERKAVISKSDRALLVQTVTDNLRQSEGRVNSHHCNNDPNHEEARHRHGHITDRTFNRREGHQERILKTIYCPFAERERLEQYRTIEKSNHNNYATLNMFKTKIRDYKIKSMARNQQKAKSNHQHSLSANPTAREQASTYQVLANY